MERERKKERKRRKEMKRGEKEREVERKGEEMVLLSRTVYFGLLSFSFLEGFFILTFCRHLIFILSL